MKQAKDRRPQTELQALNTNSLWTKNFQLQPLPRHSLSRLRPSAETLNLAFAYNKLTKLLQDSIQADYDNNKARILKQRERAKKLRESLNPAH